MKNILCYMLISILLGCMNETELVEDIKFLPKPNGFEQVSIDSILKKYIDIGMPREEVADFLKFEGFSSLMKDEDDTEKGEKIHWITYLDKTSFSALPKFKVIVEVNFFDQKVSEFSGFYLRNY